MAEAVEVVTSWLNGSAPLPKSGRGGHIDANLQIRANETVAATALTPPAIDTEGGAEAELVTRLGAVTGTTPSATFTVQCSIDGGSNYFTIMTLPALDAGDANQEIGRIFWLPRPLAPFKTTKVRVQVTVAGTAPSFAGVHQYLRDLGHGATGGREYLT